MSRSQNYAVIWVDKGNKTTYSVIATSTDLKKAKKFANEVAEKTAKNLTSKSGEEHVVTGVEDSSLNVFIDGVAESYQVENDVDLSLVGIVAIIYAGNVL